MRINNIKPLTVVNINSRYEVYIMNNVVVINNIHGYSDEKGTAWLAVKDLAVGLGLGFKQIQNGKEYDAIRWNTMENYLREVGFDFLQHRAKNSDLKDAYIQENKLLKMRIGRMITKLLTGKISFKL